MRKWLSIILACLTSKFAHGQATRPALTATDVWDPDRPARAAMFRAGGFPTADAPVIEAATLDEGLKDLPVDTLPSEDALNAKLRVRDYDVLVLPYGSAFPLGSWPAIRGFLERGGGLVVLGGAPFHQPVRWDGERWVLGPRQPTYAHELLIGPAEAVKVGDPAGLRSDGSASWYLTYSTKRTFPTPGTVWALTVRFTTKKDFDKEDGTSGPRDAILRPHVVLVRDGQKIACPLLEIDRMRGSDAGARWVFAPSDATLDASIVRWCIERALLGAIEVDARPVHALVHPGEPPIVRVTVRRPRIRKSDQPATPTKTWELRQPPLTESRPGTLHHAATFLQVSSETTPPELMMTGYFVRRDELLSSGPKLTVSRDWIRKDGKVFPIVGTTYMASDVHRKFLFEPNPWVWDRDFSEMQQLGVNFVRTGLWTAWSRAMLDSGAVDEGVLRALEAYVQIAATRGIVVCFNFFAFQPPMFGGVNPFLDPRALEGQKALLTAVASRFKGCNWVHWDLINEPSYCPADKLWTNQPIGDEFEKRAWTDWVIKRHGSDPLVLRDIWRDASPDVLSIPKLDELSWTMIREHRRPRKAADFARFTQDVVAKWAADLNATLKAASGQETLVTLGQDEGGTHVRPAQQLYAPSVDYTSIHTWWNNDDLLWDGVMTKVPEKPSLIQETGLMRLEDQDGLPWRSPEDAAKLLERKFAYSFMGRGCGVIQWAWNINPYMPIDNESVIGFVRPDGTMKPEARVLADFAAFFGKAAPHLDDFEPDEVVLVIPHSRIFAGRPRALDATRRIVRLMAEHLGIVPTAISDHALAGRLGEAKLVIIPAAEMLDPSAFQVLPESRRSPYLLTTGAPLEDCYGVGTMILTPSRPVAGRERTKWAASGGSTDGWVTFDSGESEWLRCGTGESTELLGATWHEPLPLEYAREPAPLLALLKAALEKAGVRTNPSDTPVAARVLLAPNAALVIVANETSADARRSMTVDGKAYEIPCPAGRARMALIGRERGEILASTPGQAVERK
jgi:hypothetical protein